MSQELRGTRPVPGPGHLQDSDDDPLRWSQLRHFLHSPLRRPLLVLVPWGAVLLLSVVALFVLPKKYMSSTLILVESEKVPESFIPKVATGDRSQRLEAVRPEILSRTRLERVLEETRPYPDVDSKTQAVEKMRRAIFISVTGNDGFTIQFYHSDPRKAQEVADRLARLFIDETIKSREQQVEGAVDFLVTQVKEARTELESKDAALRRYKEEHMGRLPEQLQTNLATMQMFQRELQAVEESLFFAREKQEALARGVGRPPTAVAASAPPAVSELAELKRQLASLRNRYTDEHPDVQSLRARIARMEARLAEIPAADDADPAILVTRGQLERANLEVRKLEDRQRDLQRRIAAIGANIEETPRTEQELATLTRDYQKLNENYVALLSKQLEAQMSGRLEQRWKGERFRMLDPANLPEKPVFPKPSLFLGLGAVVGLLIGLGAAVGAEYLDHTVKDVDGLQSVQGYPVLACIPHLADLADLGLPPAERVVRHPAVVHEGHREEIEKPRGLGLPGEVGFRDEGTVTPGKVSPIIESLKDHNSFVGEELRLLGANLLDLCRRRKVSCLAVTSALPGEGKSTIAMGLASALAREPGRRILLIEADLRRPSLTSTLGLPSAPGLSECLNATINHVPVRAIEPGGFFLLAAGQIGRKRPELVGSPQMAAVLRASRRAFDFVLLDGVPVLPVADAVLVQDLVDGFLLVARSRHTPHDAIREAMARLRADTVLGLVLNDHREYRGSYKESAYRRYRMDSSAPVARRSVDAAPGHPTGSVEAPATARSATSVAAHDHHPREPALAAAGLTLRGDESGRHRRRKPLAAVGLAGVVLAGAAVGYVGGRGRPAPVPAAPAGSARTTLNPETVAALARLKVLEERLRAIEAEKAAAAAQAADDARKKVVAQAAAHGRSADPNAVARAQEEARRRAQAEQDQRLREEQERLQAEQRAAQAQLTEQRARPEPAPAPVADGIVPPTTATPVATPPPTVPPAVPATARPATIAGALVNLSDPGVIGPVVDRATRPIYPPVALRQRFEGTVQLLALIDESGQVTDTRLVAGVRGRWGFNEAAVSAVRARKYRPATQDGVPVKVWLPVTVEFKLP